MARGDSGRIVLEIDPAQKGELYTAISKEGLTLKEWFLRRVDEYIRHQDQMMLFPSVASADKPADYFVRRARSAGRKADK